MDEPLHPSALTEADAPAPPPATAPGGSRRRWLLAAAAVVVIAAVTVALVLTLGSHGAPRGAATARAAATGFVAAVDAGDRDRAAGLACAAFTDQAGQFARTGSDAGIDFALVAVSGAGSPGARRASVTETLHVAGRTQTETIGLALLREQGRWLVCGRTRVGG